jgi:hypothetical protein
MSQREVAETTRIKFGLEKFSHSTVCRSFKALEKARNKRFGEEFNPSGTETESDSISTGTKRFPKINDTAERRIVMSSYLSRLRKTAEKPNSVITAKVIVRFWNKKYKCLLL